MEHVWESNLIALKGSRGWGVGGGGGGVGWGGGGGGGGGGDKKGLFKFYLLETDCGLQVVLDTSNL